MSSSFLDFLPSHERDRLRRRLRSPMEYERLREKVKGPEDLKREMQHNEALADISFAIETEPAAKDALKKSIEKDLREQGAENLLEDSDGLSPEILRAIEAGAFDVSIDTNPHTNEEQMMLVPEGNVTEKIPLSLAFSEKYTSGFFQSGGVDPMVTIRVNIDNDLCGFIDIPASMTEQQFMASVEKDPDIRKCLAGRSVVRYTYEPGVMLTLRTT